MFCSCNIAQKSKQTYYKIEIEESGMLFDNFFTIKNDSIIIKNRNIGVDSLADTSYSKVLADTAQIILTKALAKVDLNKIEKNYVDNKAPDDLGEYDFKILIGTNKKEFHIYRVKVDEIFNLVKQINTLLPNKFRIGYDDSYFNFGK